MNPPNDGISLALEAVLDRFGGRVRGVGFRHGLTGRDVDDLVQEVRVRLWKALQNGENIEAAPASYIYRTAASAALDLLRRRRARRETPVRLSRASGEAILGESPGPDSSLEGSELSARIGEAVGSLANSRRSVVRMHLAGYSRDEIADLLGWTEAKTRNLLYRGLNDLRETLTEMGIGPEATE